ncbi:MAG: hypothetical protein ABW173_05010, partial [Sphingomonas sp.]
SDRTASAVTGADGKTVLLSSTASAQTNDPGFSDASSKSPSDCVYDFSATMVGLPTPAAFGVTSAGALIDLSTPCHVESTRSRAAQGRDRG